jgi:peptide/nickel transport system substrate-binding protein
MASPIAAPSSACSDAIPLANDWSSGTAPDGADGGEAAGVADGAADADAAGAVAAGESGRAPGERESAARAIAIDTAERAREFAERTRDADDCAQGRCLGDEVDRVGDGEGGGRPERCVMIRGGVSGGRSASGGDRRRTHRSLRAAREVVVLGALATAAVATAPGCSCDLRSAGGEAGGPRGPGTAAVAQGGAPRPLEMLVAADPETLDPRYATDAVGLRATRLVHAGLVRLDPDTLEPRPYLARGWQWQDALTLRVDLRDDVRFHSGAPLRARDVVATFRAVASPAVGSRLSRVLDAIAEVREDGDHAVIVRLARAHATLPTDLELPILRADQAASPPAPTGTLDGLGPYAVASVTRGEVRLVPAEGGPIARPFYGVTLRTVHDENTRALRLEAGRADVALNLVSPTLLPALAAAPGLAVASRAGANLTYVVVQEERPHLGDARVRQALSAAIDRAGITGTLFDGRAHPAANLIAPTHWLNSAHAAPAGAPALAFDPDAARALLAAAGAGALRLTLLTSTERLRGDVARVIAQELRDVGVEADVVPLELGTLIARLNAGEFDLAILQLPEMTEPNVFRHFLHSSFVPPAGANRGRVRDPELDAILDEGDGTPNQDARRPIYARFEAHERQTMHVVPLWYEDQVAVTSDRARAFVPSAEGRWLSLAWLK